MEAYWKRFYCKTVTEGVDALTVSKDSGTEWSMIEMHTNDESNGGITIRSKEHAEHLWFTLGQMLGKRLDGRG